MSDRLKVDDRIVWIHEMQTENERLKRIIAWYWDHAGPYPASLDATPPSALSSPETGG